MSKNHLITTNNSFSDFVHNKGLEIKQNIQDASEKLSGAKAKAISSQNAYNNTPWYKPVTKHKLNKARKAAMDDLILANSESNIQIFKILHSMLELILIVFKIPMDAIAGVAKWCANGFEERDAVMSSMITTITPFLKNNKSSGRRKNVLEGCIRIIIVVVSVIFIIFLFSKIFSHKKAEPTTDTEAVVIESNISQEVSAEDTIDSLQKRISELEASLNEIKSNQQNIIQPVNENSGSDFVESQEQNNNFNSFIEETENVDGDIIDTELQISEDFTDSVNIDEQIDKSEILQEVENTASPEIENQTTSSLDDLDIDSLLDF